jgi:hypothetical protein
MVTRVQWSGLWPPLLLNEVPIGHVTSAIFFLVKTCLSAVTGGSGRPQDSNVSGRKAESRGEDDPGKYGDTNRPATLSPSASEAPRLQSGRDGGEAFAVEDLLAKITLASRFRPLRATGARDSA